MQVNRQDCLEIDEDVSVHCTVLHGVDNTVLCEHPQQMQFIVTESQIRICLKAQQFT